MALDPSIALGVKPLEVANPLAQYGQVAQLQHYQQQNALAQRAMSQEDAINQAYAASVNRDTGQIDPAMLSKNVISSGYGAQLPKIQKSMLDTAHVKAQTDDLTIKALGNTFDNFTKMNPPTAAAASPQGVASYITNLYADPLLGAVAAKQMPLDQAIKVNQDAALKDSNAWITAHSGLTGAHIFDTLKGTRQNTNLGGVNRGETVDAYGRPVAGTAVNTPMTMTPGERATDARARDRLAAETASGDLSPQTVDFVAETYRQTGQLPPLGMGKAAVNMRQKVLERAAQLSMGTGDGARTAAEAASDVKTAKSELAGATAGQRVLGGQIANVQIAANEANKMIKIARPYVDKVDPTDYPTLNSVGNYVASKTGDPNIVGLATALNSLVNTYARAINPKGVATVSDKNHAREVINAAMSKGQINEAFTVMGQEMDAALASGPETRAAMRPQKAAPAMQAQDTQALEWANANPKDPRAAEIKQRLGVK